MTSAVGHPEDAQLVVVDDDEDAARSLKTLLELDGYRVRVAHTAAEALRVVAEHLPLCVLLDLGLPDADGNDLARRLRARHGSGLILVAVTGRGSDDERREAEAAGIDFVMVKPLDPARLAAIFPPIR